MRDPRLPKKNIGKPGGEPTKDLRSPEDRLSLWQWCSVNWIGRLQARAGQRQLNDEDVWSLSFQFQHRQLHDRFRQLHGSVIKRLLIANWPDLIFVTLFSLLNQASGISALNRVDVLPKES